MAQVNAVELLGRVVVQLFLARQGRGRRVLTPPRAVRLVRQARAQVLNIRGARRVRLCVGRGRAREVRARRQRRAV